MVDLIDPRTRKRRLRIALRSPTGAYVGLDVAFLPDGRDLLVEQIPGYDAAGTAAVLRRFDGTTGAAEGPPLRVADTPRSGCGHDHGSAAAVRDQRSSRTRR